MFWVRLGKNKYHLMRGRGTYCGVSYSEFRGDINHERDPPGDERCKNCMRSIDHMHHMAHVHDGYTTDLVVYRHNIWPMIFTRKLIVCTDFGEIIKTFTDVWVQQSGDVRGRCLRDAIAVYPVYHDAMNINTDNVEIIKLDRGRYYRFE